ncbi:MAG: GTPase HflX [Candidatus Stygibacter frigidus]|nr:GTPase HflX [Candidatus Stygibacter frigidus]
MGLWHHSIDEEQFNKSFEELFKLAKTAGVAVKGKFTQHLKQPVSATFIGSGKLNEIARSAKEKQVQTLIFNEELSSSQARNIANITRCNVVDRTELILDIFASHARTKQAKLQVELAQLEYSYSRLKNRWKHLSRIQGGIGFRGPGEKQIEVDRREIKTRINILQKRLEEIRITTETKRKKRDKVLNITIVGYTNAGKSSLFNMITKKNNYTANKLFATLDAKASRVVLTDHKEFVVSDTIGFISNLPHNLIESFNSTLLDVQRADLLLHVVDITIGRVDEMIESVENVLLELGADKKNMLIIFNKIDLVQGSSFAFLKKRLRTLYPDSIFLSTFTREGFDDLLDHISYFISEQLQTRSLIIPDKLDSLLNFVRINSTIHNEYYDKKNKQHKLDVKINETIYKDIVLQLERYQMLEYINS